MFPRDSTLDQIPPLEEIKEISKSEKSDEKLSQMNEPEIQISVDPD